MLIKKKDVEQQHALHRQPELSQPGYFEHEFLEENTSRDYDNDEREDTSAEGAYEPPPPEWNEDNFNAGVVPDRRREAQANERRGGWRRIEDRDLISRAHEEANAIREKAEQEGYQSGLDRAAHDIQELRSVIESQKAMRDEALQSVAREISGLAMEVAARILKTEVSCDETLVMSLVNDAIQKSSQRGGRGPKSMLVKVNPDDVSVVKASLKEQAEAEPHSNAPEMIVMGDASVDTGSCILETDSGMIDASFSTQLEILYRLFNLTPSSEEPA